MGRKPNKAHTWIKWRYEKKGEILETQSNRVNDGDVNCPGRDWSSGIGNNFKAETQSLFVYVQFEKYIRNSKVETKQKI